MKEGWEYKKLGEVATFTRGLTYSKNDEAEISDNIVLRSNNVDLSTGKLNFDELKYLRPEFLIPEEKKVKKGSLLMCMSNGSKIHLGKVALINDDYPYAFGGFMALVTPNEELNPQFFNYSLSSPEYKDFIKKLSEGANINNIKVKELELFTIPVPPLSEQQSIVDYLDAAFAKIDAMKANAEKRLNEAKALFQASLKEMLEPKEGWEEKVFGDLVVSNIVGLTRGKVEQGYDRKYPYFKMNNISPNNTLCWDDLICVDANEEELEKYCLQEGDFLFNTRNSKEWVGKSTVYRDYDAPVMLYNNNVMRIRFVDTINPVFVAYSFLADYTKDQLDKIKSGTTNVWAIYYRDLSKILLTYPLLSEQQSIVETLDSLKSKVDRLQANYDKISQECNALKQAILRQVFE